MRPLVELYKEARQQYAEDLAQFQAERERYEVERDRWKAAQKKGAGPTDPPAEPEAPTERRLLVSDVTCEKLGVLLQDNPLGLLLGRDELAAWIGAFDRYAFGRGERRAGMAVILRCRARCHRPEERRRNDLR